MKVVDLDTYRRVCIKYGMFTCGTATQYAKVEKMIRSGCSLNELAYTTWVNSDDSFSCEQTHKILVLHLEYGYPL